MFTKPLKDQHLKTLERISLLLWMMIPGSVTIAQENPWASKKGNNPWGTTEEVKEEKKLSETDSLTVQLDTDTLTTESPVLTVKEAERIQVPREMDMVYIDKYKRYFYKVPNSNFYAYSTDIQDTIFLSGDEGKILILDRKNSRTLYHLEHYAKAQHKAPGAFIGSFISSALLNVFSIPVNLISLAFPSYGKERFVTDYINDNQTAKSAETKSIKKGIFKKRAQNTGAGTLSGIVLSTILWFNVFN